MNSQMVYIYLNRDRGFTLQDSEWQHDPALSTALYQASPTVYKRSTKTNPTVQHFNYHNCPHRLAAICPIMPIKLMTTTNGCQTPGLRLFPTVLRCSFFLREDLTDVPCNSVSSEGRLVGRTICSQRSLTSMTPP